jgi:protein-L-isoaspartate O-methyltransferase
MSAYSQRHHHTFAQTLAHTWLLSLLHCNHLLPAGGELHGKVMMQNLPSIVAALVLDPQPGMRVLDMCAAPGGKTTMLAQLMGNQGEVIGLDRSHNKVGSTQQWLGCDRRMLSVPPQRLAISCPAQLWHDAAICR